MNEDHADSLALYLRHLAKVQAAPASTARMEDVTVDGITLSYALPGAGGKRKHVVIEFEPPLASLADARVRLVAMSHAGSAAFGQSPIRVRKYVWPSLQGWANFIGVTFGVYTFANPTMLAPDGFMTQTLFMGNTLIPGYLVEWRYPLLGLIAAIHVAEAVTMYRLAWKHCPRRINAFGQEGLGWTGWQWVASCFCEGVTAFQRLRGLIKQEEDKHKKN